MSRMKIIYGTDFSPSTSRPGKFAAALARTLGDTLLVAHVIDPPSFFVPGASVLDEPLVREMTAKAAERVKVVAAGLRATGDPPPEERVLVGRPEEMLAELSQREEARLIVVGTHGRTALGRFFVGTVAERLMRSCRRPVLVVPATHQRLQRDDLGSTRPLRVTVAVDRSVASGLALDFVRSLQRLTPCTVSFVHVFSPPDECARLGLDPALPTGAEADAEVVAILEHELRPLIADFPDADGRALRIQPRRANEPDPLGWAATVAEADLLVVGSSLGTKSRPRALETVRSALIPVLSIAAGPIEAAPVDRSLTPWRSVLAATDLSRDGNAAVAEAYRLLSGTGGVVELCLVQEPELHPRAPENWAELQKRLWSLVPATADQRGIVTRTSIVEGRPAGDKLLQAAERLGVDALVLGAAHRGGLARALMGSVVDAIVSRSSRPVVLVPAAERDG
jgi:nucleotide-binding universal stress UspA family protein